MIKKLVKPKKKSISTLRNKADRLLQETGRRMYTKCLVCGNPMSCLHHYHPKSTCSALRYHWDNLIPLCVGCHFSHHNGNPDIHNAVNRIKGEEWQTYLSTIKRNTFVRTNREYYEKIIKSLMLLKK